MIKKRVGFVVLTVCCLFSLAGCLTKFEKSMIGEFYVSSLSISSKKIDVDYAFDSTYAVMNRSREFSIDVGFDAEYLAAAETRAMIREIVAKYKNGSNDPDSVEALLDEVLTELAEGYKISGHFSNNNGVPIFTPSSGSASFAQYGLNDFTYDYNNDTLTIKGIKYGIVSEFVFTKIK
ncbi:MAG: hypothetical protein LBQ40_07495 [Clostridiales bacterium]|nr:hypothetical protein [Clostridiales bacterium]